MELDSPFQEEEDEDDYEYEGSEEEEEDVEYEESDPGRIVVDFDATTNRVGRTRAYQWIKELKGCKYEGYQNDDNPCVFRISLWRDFTVQLILDEHHPYKPPKFSSLIPSMDPETTLLLTRMEYLEPTKWNFCTKLNDLLIYAEAVVKKGRPADEWTRLEKALFDLGDLLQASPKCSRRIESLFPQLPQFGAHDFVEKEEDLRKLKTRKIGWSSGTGFGAGVISQAPPNATQHKQTSSESHATAAPSVSSNPVSKSEETNKKLEAILDAIVENARPEDSEYVLEDSTWQPAVQAMVWSASHFDFEKYEELYDKIEKAATLLKDDETLLVLRRRHPEQKKEEDDAHKAQVERKSSRKREGGEKTQATPYQELIAPFHVLQCSMPVPTHRSTSIPTASSSSSSTRDAPPPTPKLIKRALREFYTLREGLPLLDDSAIFARHNSDNLLHFKLMIVPSSETPYAYGCYVFSILLPHDYPASPPNVFFETTDNNTVRFNPNLYANGRVCLSLIGTWPGRPEERWDKDNSNLLTLALSIQALVFTSEPYFNEPGYEAFRGTKEGEVRNRDYNANIRKSNKRVAIDNQYRSPPPEFSDVIRNHVEFHRSAIDLVFPDVADVCLKDADNSKATSSPLSHFENADAISLFENVDLTIDPVAVSLWPPETHPEA